MRGAAIGRLVAPLAMVLLAWTSHGLGAESVEPTVTTTPQLEYAINPQHEYNVKAAFLYSFGRYIEWPSAAFGGKQAPFVIGVLGEDPFGGALDRIAQSKQIQHRPIVVYRMQSLEQYRPCHILFVSKAAVTDERMLAIRKLSKSPVLLVGDQAGFAREGGTVSFFVDQETVRFEINVDTVKRQRLAVDAKLLKLAMVVQGPEK